MTALHPLGDGLLGAEVAPGLWRLADRRVAAEERSYFYLLTGDDGALLIDGGWGLDPVVADLPVDPGTPLTALATHSHFDHIGALADIAERWGPAQEAPVFAAPTAETTQAYPYLRGRPVCADGGCLTVEPFWIRPCPLTHVIDGDCRLTLAGFDLDIRHVPGHSPGSLAVFLPARGWLFSGDTVHDGFIYDAIPGASAAALLRSHRRLAALPVAAVYPGHGAVLDRTAFHEALSRHRARRGQRG